MHPLKDFPLHALIDCSKLDFDNQVEVNKVESALTIIIKNIALYIPKQDLLWNCNKFLGLFDELGAKLSEEKKIKLLKICKPLTTELEENVGALAFKGTDTKTDTNLVNEICEHQLWRLADLAIRTLKELSEKQKAILSKVTSLSDSDNANASLKNKEHPSKDPRSFKKCRESRELD